LAAEHTRVFKDELHVINCNDLSLSLTHVNIAIHADDLADLRVDIAVLDRELSQVFDEPGLSPLAGILTDPVPVVGVVENHVARLLN
jgi:hypothetical protein